MSAWAWVLAGEIEWLRAQERARLRSRGRRVYTANDEWDPLAMAALAQLILSRAPPNAPGAPRRRKAGFA